MRGTEPECILLGVVVALCLCGSPDSASEQLNTGAVEKYSQQAEQALARKDLEAAATALKKLAELEPRAAEVYGNLGMVYYSQGRMAEATESFQRAVKLNPKMSTAQLMLGICYAEIGRNEQAILILAPTFREPPDDKIGRLVGLELQRAYVGVDEYNKAGAVLDELLNRYPNDPEIIYRTAHWHGDLALHLMIRLEHLAPDSVWMVMARAEVDESQKRYELAAKEYRHVMEMNPRLPGVHFRLGRVLELGSNNERAKDEALQAFQQELKIYPGDSGAWYEMGEIYRQRGRLREALEAYWEAVERDAGFEEAQIALGRTLIDVKRPHDALPHLLAAVHVKPTNDVSHFLLATAYKKLGDARNYQREVALFQKYHARHHESKVGAASGSPGIMAAPEHTKQILDSDAEQP